MQHQRKKSLVEKVKQISATKQSTAKHCKRLKSQLGENSHEFIELLEVVVSAAATARRLINFITIYDLQRVFIFRGASP